MGKISAYYRYTAALLALAGCLACRKTQDPENPILFTCSPVEVSTRADNSYISTSSSLPQGQRFAVYGWDTGSSFFTAGTAPGFLNPLPVTFQNNEDQGKNNTYSLASLFWPRDGVYKYTFCAYYPYEGDGISAPAFASGTVGRYTFTAQSNPADMVDFCVSDVANDLVYGHTNSYSGTVPLRFHHMLTRVQIKFISAQENDSGVTIRIKDAKLQNIKNSGTLTATYTQPSPTGDGVTGNTSFAWSSVQGQASYDLTLGGVNPEPGGPTVTLGRTMTTASEDMLLLVPQALLGENESNPQQLSFTWEQIENGASGSMTIPLSNFLQSGTSNTADIHWDANSSVTYTIVLRAETIQFGFFAGDLTVSIAPWGEDVNGYFDIID